MYHNSRTDFRSYFLSFDGGARLELMTRPQMEEADPAQSRLGYAHLPSGAGDP